MRQSPFIDSAQVSENWFLLALILAPSCPAWENGVKRQIPRRKYCGVPSRLQDQDLHIAR